jgi:sarcosine oxidase subunit alpha
MSGRLPPVAGEWIDRTRPIDFRFEGRPYRGYAGDSVSSALLANGVRMLGRSFKYHRPRGVLSCADHDVNAMLQWGARLNLRADVEALCPGMDLAAVNTRGGLAADRARFIQCLSPFLPVGFYYKAFYSKRWFPRWERMFRGLAGLGEVRPEAPRRRTPKRYGFCDVLVVGGGPSGLAAALRAAAGGAATTLVEENPALGGSGLFNVGADAAGREAAADLVRRVLAEPRITVMTATAAVGAYADRWIALADGARMTKLRARSVVLAAGAYEQPAVFRNNDLPGVMLASAAQRLIYRHAVQPCARAVVLAANDDGYRAALDLAAHGVEVAAVVDLRASPGDSPLRARVRAAGMRTMTGVCIAEARGRDRVRAVAVAGFDADRGAAVGAAEEIACDGVMVGVGWMPAVDLLCQAGGRLRYAAQIEQFVPAACPAGYFAAGRVNGVHELQQRIADGERAADGALAYLGMASAAAAAAPSLPLSAPSHPYPIVAHARGANFVDFDEDLVLADLRNAAQEGFDGVELLKRYSTVGMGPSQGKHSSMNAIRILARIRGEAVDALGTTTARPFVHPVAMAKLAGRGFHPVRRTALHGRHQALGAKFMLAGDWVRPEFYRRGGADREACVGEEVAAVRTAVGLIDVGTLGKIEVSGPDAAEFVERIYTGRFANLRVGMTRYGLMLDETGVIVDDGIVARLAEGTFYLTTTTSAAAAVHRELARWNLLWRLRCGIVNATGQRGAVNVAGPQSRRLLAALTSADLSEAAFPYLGLREIEVAGVPLRALRVGFVGELGYELHAPADCTAALWDALMQAGAALGVRAVGVEAQRVLRLEKGHIIVGQDSDGLTTPGEAACDWAVRMDKRFFVGQRSLRIIRSQPLRRRLTPFELAPGEAAAAVADCHLVIEAGEIAGRVTSVAWSAALGKHIGLAMLDPQRIRGERFHVRVSDGRLAAARIVTAPFYDPAGRRQQELTP